MQTVIDAGDPKGEEMPTRWATVVFIMMDVGRWMDRALSLHPPSLWHASGPTRLLSGGRQGPKGA